MRTATRSLLAAFALAMVLTACGDTVTVIECEPGTIATGDKCVPIGGGDTVGGSDTGTPQPDVVAPDQLQPDVPNTDTGRDTASPDVAPDTTTPGPTGAPCVKNADCEGGTCLDWQGGYCTLLDCDPSTAPCAADSACLAIQAGNKVCLAECTLGSASCATAAQACKRLQDAVTGEASDICVGVDSDAGGPGAGCGDATDCAGAATCLSAFPGGYCAQLGCDSVACPSDATCVRLNGQPTCLATCSGDADCGSTPGAERACGTLSGLNGQPVQACISGVSGAAVGAACLSDFECDSGSCQILGDGRCSQSDAPCFEASAQADCGTGALCIVSGTNRVGVCTQPCGPGVGCGGSLLCVPDGPDPASGLGSCRPTCDGPGGSVSCPAELSCRFGVAIGGGGQGRYACSVARPRGFGAACQGAASCTSGHCIGQGASGGGICAAPCADDDACPFSGTCLTPDGGGDARCQTMCFSAADCPSGYGCDFFGDAARIVCVPQ